MGRIQLKKLTNCSPFRKVAMGTWKTAKDPSVYGILEIDVDELLVKIETFSQEHGIKITVNHLIAKAVAYCFQNRPELNGLIRGSRIYLRQSVNIVYLVNIPGDGKDKVSKAVLSSCTIEEVEKKTIVQMAKELEEKVQRAKRKEDKVMQNNMKPFEIMPWWMAKYYLSFASWLVYGLNWDLTWLGIPKDLFGSVIITNVGSLGGDGIDLAWSPIVPYSRVPLLLTICAITKKPWVVDDKIVIRKILPITITFDHRFIDGAHSSQMAKDFKKCFAEPEKYLLDC